MKIFDLLLVVGRCKMNGNVQNTAGSSQREPPRLVLEVGGTSTKQATMPGELKSPPTWNLEVGGGTSTLQA